jgi:hypothetical protein
MVLAMSNARLASGLALATTLAWAGVARADDLAPLPAPPSAAPPTAPVTSPYAPPSPSAMASAPPSSAPPSSAASLRVSVHAESKQTADAPTGAAPVRSIDDEVLLHGFRFGYGFVMNYDEPVPAFQGQSLKTKVGLRSPHHFLLGYELVYRVTGHSWLNVLLIGNGMVAGLEQSKLLPSANLMLGFEIKNSFQLGVGANLSPLKGSEGHTVLAAGWTPKVGRLYTPVHAYFIPDVDGVHRIGLTTGVTF